MRTCLLSLFCLFAVGCASDPEAFIPYIEGYWEIDQVFLYNGTQRSYSYNDTIDYFEVTDSLRGFRKKMNPNFKGTFESSRDVAQFVLQIENDSLNIIYNTPNSNWKESILMANDSQLKIINQNKDVYLYRKYEPISID